MRRTHALGLLYSRSGSYARIGTACRSGALAAIAAVNADPARRVAFQAHERDPGGNIDLYAPLCADLLHATPARHIVGCVTSWSRKEVIPVLEKAGGTLWYAVPYEGFEASDRVVYLHSCPNQHLIPLLAWAIPTFGRRGYLAGSNYIWGWEMNRLARERIGAARGSVLGERYLPIGSEDVARMIDEVEATAPDFILNSLIGPSSYAFLRAYAALGARDPRFRPERCPVLSCNLTECELPEIAADAEGLISAGPFFRAKDGFANSFEAAAQRAVMVLADLLEQAPEAGADDLTALLASPAGAASGIDPKTHHMPQPALVAQVRNGAFEVVHDAGTLPGDPYLTLPAPARAPGLLRVVS